MPCNSPNKVFYIGVNEDTGKKKILFTSRHVDFIYRKDFGDRWNLASNIDLDHAKRQGLQVVTESDKVPCGQCLGCRLDYARQWAVRCMCEAKNYKKDQLWFVTLTYDDEHLPEPREMVDPVTGEIQESPFSSLSKRDHTLFMKNLRKHYGKGIRFFMSGEYGSITYRPHYHYLLFGIVLDDLVPIGSNWRGERYWRSPNLERIWNKGFVTVGNLDFDSANYVARYVLKKQKGQTADYYDTFAIDPEFCLMSRNPGIGKDYFDDNYEVFYETDEIVLPGHNGAIKTKPPKYYDRLFEKQDPVEFGNCRDRRKRLADQADVTRGVLRPFLDDEDIFSSRERKLKNQVIIKKKGEI